MIKDLLSPREPALPQNPVVVVGSGAAGIPLSLELADRGHQVVVLESGGDVRDRAALRRSAALNKGRVDGQAYSGLEHGRARILGGTTHLWPGQCMRLFDIDLQGRPWIPRSGWPIRLADLDSYYAAAEGWLDVSGGEYLDQMQAPLHGPDPLRWTSDHLLDTFTEFSRRPHLGAAYRRRMAKHPNLWVLLNASATCIRVDGGQVRGVEVAAVGGRRLSLDAAVVVLAAGTIENTRLLQLSDPAGVGLGWGREHTGRYFQDHPIIRTAEITAPDAVLRRYMPMRHDGRLVFRKLRLAPRAQEELGLVNAAAIFHRVHDRSPVQTARRMLHDLRHHSVSARAANAVVRTGTAPVLLPDVRRGRIRGLPPIGGRPEHIWLEIWVEQAPKADRRVSLADSRDPLGLPQPAVTWSCEPEELEASRRLTRWIAEDLRRLRIGHVQELPAMADDAAWRSTVRDGFHPAGTTRMSDSAREGVVNPDLAVHGVGGLYVVGGSVFPTSGYGNPTLTIVALALRLAAHIHTVTQPAAQDGGPSGTHAGQSPR